MEESLGGSDLVVRVTRERDSSTPPMSIGVARNDIRRKEIPRLATLARNDNKKKGILPRLSACGGSLGMTGQNA